MSIDAYFTQPHYHDHLRPILAALPAARRGHAYAPSNVARPLRDRGFDVRSTAVPRSDDPLLIAGQQDFHGRRPTVFVEHGAGQTYEGYRSHPGYAGGDGRDRAGLFICPRQQVADANLARYPNAQAAVVGCPKLDRWLTIPKPQNEKPVVAVTFHWPCFPGDVLVSGPPVVGAASRWFEGEVVVVRTASGNELTCTPNHPVLTPEGWVSAGALDVGDGLIRGSAVERMVLPVCPNDEHVPVRIEDVARAALESRSMLSVGVPVTAEDFDGDGLGSDVAVVSTDRELLHHIADATLSEPSSKSLLHGIDLDFTMLSGEGLSVLLLCADGPPATGGVGGSSQCAAVVGRHECHASSLRGASAHVVPDGTQPSDDGAERDAVFVGEIRGARAGGVLLRDDRDVGTGAGRTHAQDVRLGAQHTDPPQVFGDLPAPHSELSSELVCWLAGLVPTDEIVEVSRREFQGHVYNLQTTTGWYEANGYIVHNCHLVPEAGWAFNHFYPALAPLAQAYKVLGHAHPRARRLIDPAYREHHIEVVSDPDELVRRADVLVADNTSLAFEFAAIDRPVVMVSAPEWRRDVEHGLRFWDCVPGPDVHAYDNVGTQVNALVYAIERVTGARGSAHYWSWAYRRAQVTAHVYGGMTDGRSSERAAFYVRHFAGDFDGWTLNDHLAEGFARGLDLGAEHATAWLAELEQQVRGPGGGASDGIG